MTAADGGGHKSRFRRYYESTAGMPPVDAGRTMQMRGLIHGHLVAHIQQGQTTRGKAETLSLHFPSSALSPALITFISSSFLLAPLFPSLFQPTGKRGCLHGAEYESIYLYPVTDRPENWDHQVFIFTLGGRKEIGERSGEELSNNW